MLVPSPVLSPAELTDISSRILRWSSADTVATRIQHRAIAMARVARGIARLDIGGDQLTISIQTKFGQRVGVDFTTNQKSPVRLQEIVEYLDRIAREQPGDPQPISMPIPPRNYVPVTIWHEPSVTAYGEAHHLALERLVTPVLAEKFLVAASSGVLVKTELYADRQGILAVGQETDCEVTVSGWSADGTGGGWAGQAARDWSILNPDRVANEAVQLTRLAHNPVAVEPGRRTAILDRPAVAQIVAIMSRPFAARFTLNGNGPLYDNVRGRSKLGLQVMDARIRMRSDPNDPEGGYLPFNSRGYPLVPMTWIGEGGKLDNLAFDTDFAAIRGVTPANDPPRSFRFEVVPETATAPPSVEDMIANCKEGLYVNRLAQVSVVDVQSGMMTGVTTGGCFLIRNGRIEKSIKDLRFLDSPWFFLNRLRMAGRSERAPFGYSPWQGTWPISPTIVPPIMVEEFNFHSMADAV